MIRTRLHCVFRGVGAALALLTFGSPLLESFHEGAVRHVACPEDGRLIDAPVGAAHPHALPPGNARTLFAEGDPVGPRALGEDHHHCVVTLQAQLRAREQSHKLVVVRPPDAAAIPQVVQEPPRLRSLALYRLAPKASPPLA